MNPNRHIHHHGFAAISAIFLIVVLAALGGFMLAFSNTQQLNSAQDLQGSKAYWAARGGLEWAISSVRSSSFACPAAGVAPASIDGFTITTTCTRKTYTEGGITIVIFSLESKANSNAAIGSAGYVERSVTASIEI